ncbi:NAD(P)-binding protein [Lojkania enalia]|uniref:NAD(P)-binding protein n=1 Tax=Lojkania enalia TaxID=147567 RepID=A0A9P4TPF5_9PLEO|nr:NAD(P)-binding protein [Didymosphaeria enalia]
MASFDVERDGILLPHQFTPTMHRELYPAVSPTNPKLSAAGKIVLVTGATRGIGKGIAISWAEAGAAGIVVTGRAEDLLVGVSEEIKKLSPNTKVLAIRSEASSEDDTKNLWAKVNAEIGCIDVLICNAGVSSEQNGYPTTGNISPSLWWSDMDVNVRGTYLHIYSFLQQFISIGKEPAGTVIIVSSGAAAMTSPGTSAYSISKLAGIRLAEFLHAEHPGVRSFAYHPGMVVTQMNSGVFAKQSVDPLELAGGLSLYLSTPRADFLRGCYVSVNWDVEEMEQHANEIIEKRLLHTAFINAKLSQEGHPFEGSS